MKVSYAWLQDYFDEKLPEPEKLAEILNAHVFEVESFEKVAGGDTIFDVKVLPDRAHYALSHFGIAYEISAITKTPLKQEKDLTVSISSKSLPKISVEDKNCRRYMGRIVENIGTAETPKIIKERLIAIGQRSINPIVDAANYVMFDVGQPLHAFDADKVIGGITIRRAKEAEKITTLDNKEIVLSEKMLVIADDEGPLAIAGVKGGNRAEVDGRTERIIIESANFDPVSVRKTANQIGIKTNASKRFENNFPPDGARLGMFHLTKLLCDIYGDSIKIGEIVDVCPEPNRETEVRTTFEYINWRLGVNISEKEILEILSRLYFPAKKADNDLVVTVPVWRNDLTIPEDIIEEIGRLYGYEKIAAVLPPKTKEQTSINKNFYYVNKIKTILVSQDFSEIYTSSFDKKGDVEVLYPVASDKNFLRTDLSSAMEHSLARNLANSDLLGLTQIKLFEIGKVFKKGSEINSLCIGIANTKGVKTKTKINDLIRDTREMLIQELWTDIKTVCAIDDSGGHLLLNNKQIGVINAIDGMLEVNLDELIASFSEPNAFDIDLPAFETKQYKPFSRYPFVVRDVAVFVPEDVSGDIVWKVIYGGLQREEVPLLVSHYLFDEFEKDGKISYAFRLVFQSFDQTLTDEEVNKIMEKINLAVSAETWQVR